MNRHAAPAPLVPLTVRRWLYGVATALVPLLVVYGLVDDSTAPLWLALAAQVLATGTAWIHTPPPQTDA